MPDPKRTIVAIGGSGMGPGPSGISFNSWLLSLTGKRRPRVCLIPTASGDADSGIVTFYESFGRLRCEPSHLALFRRTIDDIARFLLKQDVIFVSGGNTANMLATWRVHGVDKVLLEAWIAGVVLSGTSAGALCWFDSGTTDSFGGIAPLRGCLGFLPTSICVHADSEPQRLPLYTGLVARTEMPAGYAVSDFAALRFEGRRLAEVVATSESAQAWRVIRHGGSARQTPLRLRLLTEEERLVAPKRLARRPVGA